MVREGPSDLMHQIRLVFALGGPFHCFTFDPIAFCFIPILYCYWLSKPGIQFHKFGCLAWEGYHGGVPVSVSARWFVPHGSDYNEMIVNIIQESCCEMRRECFCTDQLSLVLNCLGTKSQQVSRHCFLSWGIWGFSEYRLFNLISSCLRI